MNPRRLLALLGPRSPSLTRLMHREYGLRGAKSPTTPQDVAGALGWVKPPLAREVYQLLWFPGYGERGDVGRRLVTTLAVALHREWLRRSDWPGLPSKWQAEPLAGCEAVAKAVLFELQHRQDCAHCLGYGMVPRQREGKVQLLRCGPCKGQGHTAYKRAMRARLLTLRLQVYLAAVASAYDWLLATVRALEQHAAQQHYLALEERRE